MVEARTVRAYCTHSLMAMEKISTSGAQASIVSALSWARAMPLMSSATRMVGKLTKISAIRITMLSTTPPKKPATRPSTTPSTAAKTTAPRPMTTEILKPNRMTETRSRPWLSVPSRKRESPPSMKAGGISMSISE
ncbi:hypothetical protein D9M72_591920 [compost metagenome]